MVSATEVKDQVINEAKSTAGAAGSGVKMGLCYAAAFLTAGLILLGVKKATGYSPVDTFKGV